MSRLLRLAHVLGVKDLTEPTGDERTAATTYSKAQHATRSLEGADRRRALAALAGTYHLAQLFLSFQPAPELVMLTGDRAMTAAQDADGPRAIAAAAWYVNHVHRDAGEASEARVEPAEQAAAPPRPGRRGTLGGIGPRPTPPPTGSAMVEAIGAKKIGKVMGFVGSYVQLRLVGGGTEWGRGAGQAAAGHGRGSAQRRRIGGQRPVTR
ncbi:hypothetical protein RKD49_006327 [Streptomyces glaucescens]